MKIELRNVPMPGFDIPVERPEISPEEFDARCNALFEAVGLDWVAVYGDREHVGNLIWLTGYDPRFEEALLLLGRHGRRVLLVGIEGLFYKERGLAVDLKLYHPFSIIGQPHTESPPLRQMLIDTGMRKFDHVGIVGWKTADPADFDPSIPAFVPSLIVRTLDAVTGTTAVDVTGHMIDPVIGHRNRNSAAQIAYFEWGATRSSAAIMRVVNGARPGMTEYEAAGLMGLQGEPGPVYPIVSSSDGALNGLRSPSHRVIAEGDAITTGYGIWGGLSCRAGVMSTEPDEEYWNDLVEPYFRAIATWWQTVGLGVTGGELDAAIGEAIGDAPWKSFVNAGHLTSYDEWVYGFGLAGSSWKVTSGMAMQCDIIPTPLPPGRTINCEDSLAIGDEALRAELAEKFPEVWARIQARRAFMTEQLGIILKPEVLPICLAPAYLPPCWLSPTMVCRVVEQ